MPSLLEQLAARIAGAHARQVFRRFLKAIEQPRASQQAALRRALDLVRDSEFGRVYDLRRVRTPDDLRAAVPLHTYEDLRPVIERVFDGDIEALFRPRQRLLMFATSSGTTARRKLVPVTPAFVQDYRRGWNTFGLKMLSDHPEAVLRAILQSSGRFDEGYSPVGVPYGAITGLLARTQKRIVRRFYVGRPEIARLDEPRARYYVLMRLGIVRDVAFAITANPATLIQMARTADEEAETLLRDIRDGTVSTRFVPEASLRALLGRGLRPDPHSAAELEQHRRRHGVLRPRDYWKLSFLACWTGGSLGHYLERLREWYGPLPVRDIGLLASEGRVTIPLADDTPAGVLDVTAGFFEFIPAQAQGDQPETLEAHQLETGQDYRVVLTNTSGLVRYRLDDVVRVRGWESGTPVLEFLYRAGRVASVAGEKLTENQVVSAVRSAARELGLAPFEFVLAPCWDDPPYYRLSVELEAVPERLGGAVDAALCGQNAEYASRRKSFRLGPLRVRILPPGRLAGMDRRLARRRGSASEQYKRPVLFTKPGEDDENLSLLGGDGDPPSAQI